MREVNFRDVLKQSTGEDSFVCLSARERDSVVWLGRDNTVYKHASKCLIDVEYHFLTALAASGYVPAPVHRLHLELISMPFIVNEGVTDVDLFMSHLGPVLGALRGAECRHGDLTSYSVFVVRNRPVIIDFGESRFWSSPFPDKRPEGDAYWLEKTMREYADVSFPPELDL